MRSGLCGHATGTGDRVGGGERAQAVRGPSGAGGRRLGLEKETGPPSSATQERRAGKAPQFPRAGRGGAVRAQEPWRSLKLPGWAVGGGHYAQWVRRAAPLLLSKIHRSVLVLSRRCDPLGEFHPNSSQKKGLEHLKFHFGEFSHGPGLWQQVA